MYPKLIFKIAGFFQIFSGLMLVFTFFLLITADATIIAGSNLMGQIGAGELDMISRGDMNYGYFITIGLGSLNLLSAYGFLKHKKFQPTLFMLIFVGNIINVIYSIISFGFSLSDFGNIIGLLIWFYILTIINKNKSVFVN